MAKKKIKVVLTINQQLTVTQEVKIFKLIPELDEIQEKDVQYATRSKRSDYEQTGNLKPR